MFKENIYIQLIKIFSFNQIFYIQQMKKIFAFNQEKIYGQPNALP